MPSISILAEPTVSVVDKVVKKKGTEGGRQGYLDYLYSDEGQEIAARNFYRPRNQAIAAKYPDNFAKLELFTIDAAFAGWTKAQKTHFADGRHLRPDLRQVILKPDSPRRSPLPGDGAPRAANFSLATTMSTPSRPATVARASSPASSLSLSAALGEQLSTLYSLAQRSDYVFGTPLGPFYPRRPSPLPAAVRLLRAAHVRGIAAHRVPRRTRQPRPASDAGAAASRRGTRAGARHRPESAPRILSARRRARPPATGVRAAILAAQHWSAASAPEIDALAREARLRTYHAFVRIESASADDAVTLRLHTAPGSLANAPFFPRRTRSLIPSAGKSNPVRRPPPVRSRCGEDLAVPPDRPHAAHPGQLVAEYYREAVASILKRFIVRYRGFLAYGQHLKRFPVLPVVGSALAPTSRSPDPRASGRKSASCPGFSRRSPQAATLHRNLVGCHLGHCRGGGTQDAAQRLVRRHPRVLQGSTTPPSSHTGSRPPARRSPSTSRTAALPSRFAPLSTACRPTGDDERRPGRRSARQGQPHPGRLGQTPANESVPYTSTILFVVRKGNPGQPEGNQGLVRPCEAGVSVVIPNPKTSGNGRYSYLAAWIYALHQPGGNEATAREFVKKIFANVPVLDTGGRGASTTFVQRHIGDVLLTFENEVALALKELGPDEVEAIVPSVSILAENPVVWVDKVVRKKGTEKEARAYLEYLYSPPGQELAAKYYFRPLDAAAAAKYPGRFPELKLYSVPVEFGSWEKAQKTHFADGGTFDQIYQK
ncbi:MAG: sulfate ABC transporter substrate-binding protein [Lacunisphaera sp.]